MSDARARLARWISRKRLSQEQFAEQVGVSGPLVSMWLSGERNPGLAAAFAIQSKTGIPASSWAARIARRTATAR